MKFLKFIEKERMIVLMIVAVCVIAAFKDNWQIVGTCLTGGFALLKLGGSGEKVNTDNVATDANPVK